MRLPQARITADSHAEGPIRKTFDSNRRGWTMKRWGKLWLILLILGWMGNGGPGMTWAVEPAGETEQKDGGEDAAELEKGKRTYSMDEISVTATKTATPAELLPVTA
jgi:hypothetical protein